MRISLPSFVAGALAATLLVAVPATALVGRAAPDQHPKAYDGTSPSLTMRPVGFVIGESIDAAEPPGEFCAASIWNGATLKMKWSGFDRVSGLAGYDVWAAGPSQGVERLVEGTKATSHTYLGTNYTGDCGGGSEVDNHYWVAAKDNRGNTATTNQVGQHFDVWTEKGVDVTGDRASLPLTRTGTWKVSSCACSNHGKTLYSTARGAALTYKITSTTPGQVLALVVGKNTNRGTVNIRVDGGSATAVSTYASAPRHRVIVWQKVLGVGTHTVKLTNAGTSGHSRIDVDTLMLTSGPTNQSPPDPSEDTP